MPIDLSVFNAYWTFNGGIAAAGPNSPWGGALPTPSGSNFAFFQGLGWIEQQFSVTTAGTHTIAYQAQVRPWKKGEQRMQISIDGLVESSPTGIALYSWTAKSFTKDLGLGTHTLRFEGLVNADETMFVDSVTITDHLSNPVTLPNGDFDSYLLAPSAYIYNPPAIAVPTYRLNATVTISGKMLHCRFEKIADGTTVAPGQINEAPIISIGGVPRGAIQTDQICTISDHATWLVPLPVGVVAAAGEAVTISASAGWMFGPTGYAEAMVAQTVLNRVGRSFVRLTDAPRTMTLGGAAMSHGATPEWRNGFATKNQRYRCAYWAPAADVDATGKPTKLNNPTSYAPLVLVNESNYIDGTGYPTPRGYWAVRWDDLDGGTSFSLSTYGDGRGSVAEVSSLANPGVAGIGKVKVFDVQPTGTTVGFYLWLVITKADLYPHFDNLAILAPGDFTWAPGQPTTIPMPAWDELPASITNRVPKSSTVSMFRYGDATAASIGSSPSCERDHLVDPVDFHWAMDIKESQRIKYTHARPWNPSVTPYVYDPLVGTPFNATLGADIVTAPAAGTFETITISDAATAPVLAGLVLTIDSERIRVKSVSGTSVTVMRGAESTTPAVHTGAPRTISVSSRRAMDWTTWGIQNKQITEFVTQSTHRLKSGQLLYYAGIGWPLFTYTDGSTFQIWNWGLPAYVTGANTYCIIMDGIVNPNNVTLDHTFDLNPDECYVDFLLPEFGGCPHELPAAVAAQYPGSACWTTICPVASDDMVDEVARRTFAYLPLDRDCWIELGGEPWNFSGRMGHYWQAMDWMLYGAGGVNTYWLSIRTGQIRQRFRNIASALGRDPSHVKSMLNMPTWAAAYVPGVLSFAASNGVIPDCIMIAPYYSYYPHPEIYKAWCAWSTDMIVDAWIWDFYHNEWGGAPKFSMSTYRAAIDTFNAATGSNIRLLIYEYAPEIPFPFFVSTTSGAMDSSTTTLVLGSPVDGTTLNNQAWDAAKVQPGAWLRVDSEWMKVVSRTGTTCTVVRAQSGTSAASHVDGSTVVNDWVEAVRDITLHPNFRIAHYDVLAFFESYGVDICMPSAMDQTWTSGHAWSDYHAIEQLPGKGDGSDGRANNLLCLARPGPAQKSATVNQDANTVSVRGQAEYDWASSNVPARRDLGRRRRTLSRSRKIR